MLNSQIIALVPSGYLAIAALPLIITDLRERRLPNKIVVPMLGLSMVSTIVASALSGDWLTGILAFAGALLFLIAGVWATTKGALGMGDIKLLIAILLPLALINPALPVVILVSIVAFVALLAVIVIMARLPITTLPMGPVIIPIALLITFLAVSK